MIREEIKQLKTGPRDLRKFGLTVGSVFVLLGSWFWFRHKAWHPYFLLPGVLLLGFGLVVPKTLKQVYIGWMTLAFVLGFIVSTVLLTLFFYLVVTPIGLVARCFGKDFLTRKWDRQATSYWIPRQATSKQKVDYEQQF